MKSPKLIYILLLLAALCFVIHRTGAMGDNTASNSNFTYSNEPIRICLKKYKTGNVYNIQDTIDLCGKTWYIPHDISIMVKGGLITNGNIVGDMTHLDYEDAVFDKVHIKGTWIVPVIRTTMFADLEYENSLRDVFALSNPDITNNIIVSEGHYCVNALQEGGQCITVCSNTKVTLDGIITMIPNEYPGCSIFRIIGSNVTIQGRGAVIGDKHDHSDTRGEWGMGIYIDGGKNVHIKDILIKDCWGDCIYITKHSQDVLIEGCYLDNGRRQGVSVVSSDTVVINDCTITNVGGTAPQYAIDVEPNENNTIGFVLINDVKVSGCKGGVMCYGKADNAQIGTVKITNCTIDGCELCPLYFDKASSVIIENTRVINFDDEIMVICDNIDTVTIGHNFLNHKRVQGAKKVISSDEIVIGKTKEQKINRNLIY